MGWVYSPGLVRCTATFVPRVFVGALGGMCMLGVKHVNDADEAVCFDTAHSAKYT